VERAPPVARPSDGGLSDDEIRHCRRTNRHCPGMAGTTADMGSTTTAPDLAPAPKPDLAMPPASPDLAPPPPSPDLAPAIACDNAQSTSVLGANADGHHHAGVDCLGCHTGGGAPKWTVAGTLYSTVSGGAAVATINVTDANGQKLKLVTATNGNFWTGSAVAYPLQVSASRCPPTVPMVSPVSTAGCNGCHGSTFRSTCPDRGERRRRQSSRRAFALK
jgi:hypothetical protein